MLMAFPPEIQPCNRNPEDKVLWLSILYFRLSYQYSFMRAIRMYVNVRAEGSEEEVADVSNLNAAVIIEVAMANVRIEEDAELEH